MRKATAKDKSTVVDIISDSFDINPAVNWTVKQDKKRDARYKRLAKYVFKRSLRRDGIYLSEDGQSVIVLFHSRFMKDSLPDVLDKIVMAFGVIGLGRISGIFKREKYIAGHRQAKGDYIYCWFFGATKSGKGKGGPVELKNLIFEESDRQKLPIYLETTIPLNMKIYDRYGFKVYHTWEVKEKGLTFWLMKREPANC